MKFRYLHIDEQYTVRGTNSLELAKAISAVDMVLDAKTGNFLCTNHEVEEIPADELESWSFPVLQR